MPSFPSLKEILNVKLVYVLAWGANGSNSCPPHIKNLSKVWLAEGEGTHFDFLLKTGSFLQMLLQKKYCFNMRVLNLF